MHLARAPAICRGIGERLDDLQLLDDRAGPAVRDDQRQGFLVRRPDMDEMDVEPVDDRLFCNIDMKRPNRKICLHGSSVGSHDFLPFSCVEAIPVEGNNENNFLAGAVRQLLSSGDNGKRREVPLNRCGSSQAATWPPLSTSLK